MSKTSGKISSRRWKLYNLAMKFFRRITALATLAVLAFKAVGSFLSWVEKQEDSPASVWADDDEFEDA